jgi:hypothetical protein
MKTNQLKGKIITVYGEKWLVEDQSNNKLKLRNLKQNNSYWYELKPYDLITKIEEDNNVQV